MVQKVLRMTSRQILQDILTKACISLDEINWDTVNRKNIEPVYQSLQKLTKEEYDPVEQILHDIHDLATDIGVNAIIEMGQYSGETALAEQLPSDENAYGKAGWAWLHVPEVFTEAIKVWQVDRLSWWRKRDDIPCRQPHVDSVSLNALAREISEIYLREQGRGKCCSVETLERGSTTYFVVYPDDYAKSVHQHDADGTLRSHSFRATFELVFAYEQTNGTLELFAKGSRKLKEDLEDIFAEVILKEKLEFCYHPQVYQLDHLKYRSFPWATDPEDQIAVRVKQMRFKLVNNQRKIILEADAELGQNDIYDAIDECLNLGEIPVSSLLLTQITIEITLSGLPGRKAGSMTFTISTPNSCNLRDQRQERVDLALKYMQKWEIIRDKPTSAALQAN